MPRNDQDPHNTPDPQRWAFKTRREKLMSATAVTAGAAAYFYAAAAVFPPALLWGVAAFQGFRVVRGLNKISAPDEKNNFVEVLEKIGGAFRLSPTHPLAHFAQHASQKLKLDSPHMFAWDVCKFLPLQILSRPIYLWPWSAYKILTLSQGQRQKIQARSFAHLSPSNTLFVPRLPMPDYISMNEQESVQSLLYAYQPVNEREKDNSFVAHELGHARLNDEKKISSKQISLVTSGTTTILLLLSAAAGIGQGLGWSLFGLSALADGTLLAGSALLVAADICSRMGYNYASRIEEMQADRIGTRLIPDKDVAPSALLSMDPRALKDEKFMRPGKIPLRLMFRDLKSTHPSTIRRAWALVQEGKKNPEGTCPYELSRAEWKAALHYSWND